MKNLRRFEISSNKSARWCLAALLAFSFQAQAGDKGTVTESQSDKQLCEVIDPTDPTAGYACSIVTTGSYASQFSWSANSLGNAGFSLDSLDPEGSDTVSIKLGGFAFDGMISDAPGFSIGASKMKAMWTTTHVECNSNPDCDITDETSPGARTVTDTTITLSGGNNGLTLMLKGKSQSTDESPDWGSQIESPQCVSNGNTGGKSGTGPLSDTLTLEIGGVTLTANVNVNCTVRTNTVPDKSDDTLTVDLTSVKATAKLVVGQCR